MSWETTSTALAAELAQVADIGQVHIEDRLIRDATRLRDLCAQPQLDSGDGEGARDLLQAWFIHRQSIEERWHTNKRTLATELYVLRGIRGLEKREGSERRFQEVIDAILAHFRALTEVADACVIGAGVTNIIEHRMFSDRLVHTTEILLEVEEWYTIGVPSVGYPAIKAVGGSDRGKYLDTADQIAGYIADISETGRVHPERRYASTRDDAVHLWSVPTESGPDEAKTVQAWQVYRQRDSEIRGLGNRISTDTTWKLEAVRSWVDSHHSGDDFQTHIDAVRDRLRGYGNLGNVNNPTWAVQQPLQVVAIEPRMLQGIMVHFAECELPIAEAVHA